MKTLWVKNTVEVVLFLITAVGTFCLPVGIALLVWAFILMLWNIGINTMKHYESEIPPKK